MGRSIRERAHGLGRLGAGLPSVLRIWAIGAMALERTRNWVVASLASGERARGSRSLKWAPRSVLAHFGRGIDEALFAGYVGRGERVTVQARQGSE